MRAKNHKMLMVLIIADGDDDDSDGDDSSTLPNCSASLVMASTTGWDLSGFRSLFDSTRKAVVTAENKPAYR